MFGIKISDTGEFLDTKDVNISCTLKSPTFRDDTNDGSYLFNLILPATDKVKKFFKFPLRMESFSVSTFESNVEIHFPKEGNVLFMGVMIAKLARPKEVEVSIGIGRGEFNYMAANKKIANVLPDDHHTIGHVEQIVDPSTQIHHDCAIVDGFNNIPSKVYPEVNYAVFPMKIEDLCKSMGDALNNAYYNTSSNINVWDMELQKFMAPLLTGNQFLLVNHETDEETHTNHLTYLLPYNIFIPFPYNSWILKNVFKQLGFFIENNPFETDPDLKRLVLYNIQALNKFKNSNEGPWTQWVNDDNGGYYLTTKRYLYALEAMVNFNLKSHVPDVEINTYIRSLENLFFCRFFINNKSRKVTVKFLKDIILSTDCEDITAKVIDIKERKFDYDKIATLKQVFDGNDGNGNLIKTKEDIDKFVRINDVWYPGDLPANSFGQFENQISYIQLKRQWFICSSFSNDFNHTSTWDLLAFEHYAEKKLLPSGKDWSTDASAIACSHFVDFKPGTSFVKYAWHLASTKQGLRFYNAYKTDENECGLRLLFYRGMQKGNIEKYENVDRYYSKPDAVLTNMIGYLQSFGHSYYEAGMIILYVEQHNTYSQIVNYLYTQGLQQSDITHFLLTYYNLVTAAEQVSNNVKFYPLGTNDVYDGQLTKIPEANLSLKWDGPYGIYEQKAKLWTDWYNNRTKPVTLLMQLEPNDLFMDLSVKKRINGVDYLIDEIRVDIKGDKLTIAEVDAWKC